MAASAFLAKCERQFLAYALRAPLRGLLLFVFRGFVFFALGCLVLDGLVLGDFRPRGVNAFGVN